MNERDATLLHDYFNGLLTPEDAQQVRDRAATDTDFGQEFELREAMETFPTRQSKRRIFADTLTAVEKDFFQENDVEKAETTPVMTAKVHWGRWLAAAASVALLAGAYWFFSQPSLPEYRQYAHHGKLSLTVRGTANAAASDAEKAFAVPDYAAALAALNRLLAETPDDITARHYQAICLMELGRTAEARAIWEPMASGQSALRGDAQWYIALSYLKENNLAACKTALQNVEPGSDHDQDVRKMLQQLK